MGSGNSTPRRRHTEDEQSRLQYRTNRGPVPASIVPQQIQNAPAAGTRTRTRSGYPRVYRNQGPREAPRQNFETYTTGPGRAAAVGSEAGEVYEYPIKTQENHHQFGYNRRVTRARQVVARENVPLNQRAYVARLPPPNVPNTTRAVVRIAEGTGIDGARRQNVVVGVMDHPPGNTTGFERAPIEPMNR